MNHMRLLCISVVAGLILTENLSAQEKEFGLMGTNLGDQIASADKPLGIIELVCLIEPIKIDRGPDEYGFRVKARICNNESTSFVYNEDKGIVLINASQELVGSKSKSTWVDAIKEQFGQPIYEESVFPPSVSIRYTGYWIKKHNKEKLADVNIFKQICLPSLQLDYLDNNIYNLNADCGQVLGVALSGEEENIKQAITRMLDYATVSKHMADIKTKQEAESAHSEVENNASPKP